MISLRVFKVRGTPRLTITERVVKDRVRKGTHKETIANQAMSVKLFQRNIKLLFRGNPASWLTGVTWHTSCYYYVY